MRNQCAKNEDDFRHVEFYRINQDQNLHGIALWATKPEF